MRAAATFSLAVLLSGCGGSSHRVVVDEHVGSLDGVRFGATAEDVRARHGEPVGGEGFFPEDAESFTGPPAIPAPDRARPDVLRYEDSAYLVSATSGVYSMMTVADGARTRAGVEVGDELEDVSERYRHVRCGEAVAGEPIIGERPTYPWCRATVGSIRVFFGEDPIESITLTSYAR